MWETVDSLSNPSHQKNNNNNRDGVPLELFQTSSNISMLYSLGYLEGVIPPGYKEIAQYQCMSMRKCLKLS